MYQQADELATIIQFIAIAIVALILYLAISTLVGSISQTLSQIQELSNSSTTIISMIQLSIP